MRNNCKTVEQQNNMHYYLLIWKCEWVEKNLKKRVFLYMHQCVCAQNWQGEKKVHFYISSLILFQP